MGHLLQTEWREEGLLSPALAGQSCTVVWSVRCTVVQPQEASRGYRASCSLLTKPHALTRTGSPEEWVSFMIS